MEAFQPTWSQNLTKPCVSNSQSPLQYIKETAHFYFLCNLRYLKLRKKFLYNKERMRQRKLERIQKKYVNKERKRSALLPQWKKRGVAQRVNST